MNILYLGEIIYDSFVTDCLRDSKQFERLDHFTKTTLDFTHVGINPQPDLILIKCDWEDHELEWAKRYSVEIPKIFITCDRCARKFIDYIKMGDVYYLDRSINEGDLELKSLTELILTYQ